MIPGPLLLIALPLVVSPLVWLVRRWGLIASFFAAGVALLMAGMAWRLPLDQPLQLWGRQVVLGEPVTLLGRDLVMSQTDRMDLVLIYLIAAGLFVFASRVSQGWTFYPLALALLSVLSAVLLVESHIFAVLLLQVAASLCVFLIQGGQVGSTRGSLRFLTFVTLAISPLLVTSWLLGRYELTPDDTSLLDTSTILFAFGFAILLGVFPFHTWIAAVSADAPPLVTTFVLGLFYAVVWFVMLGLLESFEWLPTHPDFSVALSYGGYAMIIVGAVLAAVQRRLGYLMGYAAMADMGSALLALALQTAAGFNAALFALGTRAVSLAVMGMGISLIRHRAEGDDFERLVGWGRQVPWATVALVVGGLSLAGLPPGPGFTVRWTITRLVAREQTSGALILILASVVVGISVVRAVMALLREPTPGYVGSEIVEEIEAAAKAQEEVEEKPPEPESRLVVAMIIAGLIFCLILVLWPQLHTSIIRQAADSYTFIDLFSP
jgi:formate hydrogenlyase subunit 3/multisubunit Na+/H+ antiporter MnhD subunit